MHISTYVVHIFQSFSNKVNIIPHFLTSLQYFTLYAYMYMEWELYQNQEKTELENIYNGKLNVILFIKVNQ